MLCDKLRRLGSRRTRCLLVVARAIGALPFLSVGVGAQLRKVEADPSVYSRRIIDRRDGLPESQVNSVAQSANGYFWLGTRRGLVRYDGLTFTLYEPGNTPALPTPWVNHVQVDSRQRLWISTSAGLAVREGDSVRRIDSTQVPAVDVWSAYEDRRGAVWVATEKGVFVGNGRQFTPVRGAAGFVYAVREDTRGRIWLAGRGVLAYVVGDSVVDLASRLGIRDRVFALQDDGTDRMWIGTQRGATLIHLDVDGSARIVREVSTVVRGTERPVWALARSADLGLWLGTETGGTLLFDGVRLHAMSDAPLETWAVFPDRSGVVWAGTGSGLERYQRTAFATLHDGLPDSPVWSTRLTPSGALWAALGDGSVYGWSGARFTRLFGAAREGLSVPIVAMGRDMLVADRGKTLIRVQPDGRRSAEPMVGPAVGTMLGFLAVDSALWISADSGLFRLSDGRVKNMNQFVGLPPGARPREMARDSSGRLYFGRPWLTIITGSTARRYETREGLTSRNVRAILTRGAYTWLGTSDSGLFVLHRDTIHALGALDPRLNREVLGLGADDEGFLWLSWSFGLVRVSLRDLEAAVAGRATRISVRSFDQNDGLPVGAFRGDFQSHFTRDGAGSLYAPSSSGVVRINPRDIDADTTAPLVVIEAVVVDGKPVASQRSLSLPASVGRIEFTIATPGALRPSEVRLQYRLIGVDTLWLDAGMRRIVSFGPLRGGRYRFETRAATEDGNWSAAPTVAAVDVALRLSEQPWLVPLLLFATGGAVLLITRARRVALERQGRLLVTEVAARTADLEAARESLERRVADRSTQLAQELAERERLQRALVEAQKLEGLGRLAGGVAHEINNGMTSVLGFAELATLSATNQPELLGDLDQIRRAGERVTAIVRQLLQFARRQQTERTVVDVGELVRNLTRSLEALLGDRVTMHMHLAEQVPHVSADGAQLEQVLVNLVVNARDAMPEGGSVSVHVRHLVRTEREIVGGIALAAGSYVGLSVRDTGRGIDAEVRERLFEPFFTTKGLASGTGLGLAVSHGIVREHGGTIAVESTVGQGAVFEIWLPAAPEGTSANLTPSSGVNANAFAHSGELVLLVDDDAGSREIVRRHLAHSGYRVLVAASGREALAIAETATAPIDLVVSDVRMPDLDGLAFARALRAQHGPRAMVFLTGSAGYEPHVDVDLEAFGPILAKPVSRERLHAVVREVLDARRRETSPR